MEKSKIDFYKLYTKAHNNAADLLHEAEILFEKGRFARSYFLAFTGLEELSKSQLAADVATRFITEEKFWKHYLDHKKKIERIEWASLDAEDYTDLEEETYLEIVTPSVKARMDALYVHIKDDEVITPKDAITKKEAKSLIHTLRVALERILETEFHGERIGTKGFMK